MERTQRIAWIDSLKGIAIIFVVLLHVGFGRSENYVWYHIQQAVPLFLFCSAYLLGQKNSADYFTKGRITGLVRRIVMPFVLFTVATLSLRMGYAALAGGGIKS